MRRILMAAGLSVMVAGCATSRLPGTLAAPSPGGCGWSLWRQEQVDRQLFQSKVADFPDQPACLTSLKSQVHPALPAYPMVYLTIHAERPGWLACFPTVGYEPEKYK